MTPTELSARVQKLRLSKKELAERAKVDESTVIRTLNLDTKPYAETLDRMVAALITAELEARDYLVALHSPGAPT